MISDEFYKGHAIKTDVYWSIVGMVVFALLFAINANAAPLYGEWNGYTSQGKEIFFIVNNSAINTFNITIDCPGYTVNVNTSWNTSIVGDEFHDKSYYISYDGIFSSATTATGTYNYTSLSPSCSQKLTWDAATAGIGANLVDTYLPPGATSAERKAGLIRAMDDYFDNGTLTKAELLSVLDAYFA